MHTHIHIHTNTHLALDEQCRPSQTDKQLSRRGGAPPPDVQEHPRLPHRQEVGAVRGGARDVAAVHRAPRRDLRGRLIRRAVAEVSKAPQGKGRGARGSENPPCILEPCFFSAQHGMVLKLGFRSKTISPLCHCLVGRCLDRRTAVEGCPPPKKQQTFPAQKRAKERTEQRKWSPIRQWTVYISNVKLPSSNTKHK